MQRRYSRPIPITGHARRNVLSFRSWHGTKTAHPTIIPLPAHPVFLLTKKKKIFQTLYTVQRVYRFEGRNSARQIVMEKLFSISERALDPITVHANLSEDGNRFES